MRYIGDELKIARFVFTARKSIICVQIDYVSQPVGLNLQLYIVMSEFSGQ